MSKISPEMIDAYKLSTKIDTELLKDIKDKNTLTDDEMESLRTVVKDNSLMLKSLFLPSKNVMNSRLNDLAETTIKFKIIQTEEEKLWLDNLNEINRTVKEFKDETQINLTNRFNQLEENLFREADNIQRQTFETPKLLTEAIQKELEETLSKIKDRKQDHNKADMEMIKEISREIDTRFRTIIVKESKEVYEELMGEIGDTLNSNNELKLKTYFNALYITTAIAVGIGLGIMFKTIL